MVRGGHEPDVISYSTITGSLCKDRLVNDAMEFLSEMVDRGIPPDVVTYSSILHDFCNLGHLNEAPRLFKEMVPSQMFTPPYTALMDGYCLQNQMDEDRKVLDIMVGKGCAPAS
ncbi:hypothetical protein NC652_012857 [Populus alba x Populus x berolinensis]|nr:hypothetical protein NC652_012857 [Populus alba x Populus x berolinensis]